MNTSLTSWLREHQAALVLVLHKAKRNLAHTLWISLAIGATLTMPLLLAVVLNHLSGLLQNSHHEPQLSVFLKPDAAEQTTLQQSLAQLPNVKSVTFVSKSQALENLEDSIADPTLIESLQENPLPDAFFVTPKETEASELNSLKQQIEALDGVAEVVLDSAWAKRLSQLLAFGKQALWLLCGLMGLILLTVVGNTIRMQVLNQRDEIELTQLIGGTARFIRRPFLYAGAVYGALGGVLALLISAGIIMLLNRTLAGLAAEYQTDFSLHFPGLLMYFITLVLATLIGLIAAYFAVRNPLRQR